MIILPELAELALGRVADEKLRRARHAFKKQVVLLDAHVRRIELAIGEPCAADKLELTRQALVVAAKRLMEVAAKIDGVMEGKTKQAEEQAA